MADDRLMTVTDVCDMLAISRSTLYTWLRRGFMPDPLRVGFRTIRWERESLQAWIKSGGVKAMHRADECKRLRDEAQAAGIAAAFVCGCVCDEPVVQMGEELGDDADAEAELARDTAASN